MGTGSSITSTSTMTNRPYSRRAVCRGGRNYGLHLARPIAAHLARFWQRARFALRSARRHGGQFIADAIRSASRPAPTGTGIAAGDCRLSDVVSFALSMTKVSTSVPSCFASAKADARRLPPDSGDFNPLVTDAIGYNNIQTTCFFLEFSTLKVLLWRRRYRHRRRDRGDPAIIGCSF